MALDPAGVQLVAQDANQFFGDMDRAEKAVHNFSDATEKAGGRVSAAGEMMVGALRHVGTIAIDALAEAGKAAFGFVKDSISAAGDFESGMLRLSSVTGKPVEGLNELRDQFIQLGRELPVSTAEVQEAAINLAKGGLDTATISAGGLRAALDLAAAGELDIATAAEISAKQMGVWVSASADASEKAAFLTQNANLMAQAANASTVDVEDLAIGMANVGGVAKAAGLEFDDTIQTMALLAPGFSSASDAGTSFKAFLNTIQPTTADAAGMMAQLGLYTSETGTAFYDAQGNFVGMEQASQLLYEATKDLSAEQRALALETIFGADGQRAAALIAEEGALRYNAVGEAMANAGTAAEQAKAKQAGFNTAWENAKGSVEALQITLGTKLLPVLTDLINDHIAPGINAITEFADRIFASSDPVAALVGEIDQLIPGFAGVVDTVQEVVNWFTTASDETSVLSQQAGDLASGALQFLTAAWNEDVLPAIQIVSAFFVESVLPILQNLAETVLPILNAALQVAAGFWENVLVPALKLAWNLITTLIMPVLTEVTGWLKENLPPAVQLVADFLTETLFPALNTVYTFMNDNVVPILVALADVVLAAVGKSLEALAALWENVLGPALSDLWEFVDQNIVPVLEDFSEWLGAATGGMEGITGAIKTAVDWLSDLADSIANLELPDWLTPGSPTPLELGLLGIADALRDVVAGGNLFGASLDDINSALQTTSGLVADAFGGQADSLRTQADNMERLAEAQEDLDPRALMGLQSRLNDALVESQKITDPQQAAEYYDLLSRQAFEFADLQQQYFEAQDAGDTKRMVRLSEQMQLIDRAQQAERAAFQERARTADNPYQALMEEIQAIIDQMTVTGDMPPALMALMEMLNQLGGFAGPPPGLATGGPAESGKDYIVGEEGPEFFVPHKDGMVISNAMSQMFDRLASPVMSGAQQMSGPTYNYYGQTGPSFNMGVTTNNSPGAVFQSYQMMQAMAAWGA